MARSRRIEYVGAVFGLSETALKGLPRSAPEKRVLAWWLRRRTTVSLRWLSERLAMGHFTRVSQAISLMKRRPEHKLERLRRKLIQLESGPQ
jgi:hypothetical protein